MQVLEPANLPNKPLLIETVFQMLVGSAAKFAQLAALRAAQAVG